MVLIFHTRPLYNSPFLAAPRVCILARKGPKALCRTFLAEVILERTSYPCMKHPTNKEKVAPEEHRVLSEGQLPAYRWLGGCCMLHNAATSPWRCCRVAWKFSVQSKSTDSIYHETLSIKRSPIVRNVSYVRGSQAKTGQAQRCVQTFL